MEALSHEDPGEMRMWAAEKGCLLDPQIQAMLLNLAQGREILSPVDPNLWARQRSTELGEPSGLQQLELGESSVSQSNITENDTSIQDVNIQHILNDVVDEVSNSQERKSKYYHCSLCSKKFLTYRKKNIHELSCGQQNTQHNQFTKDVEIDSALLEIFTCKECNLSFNRQQYFSHIRKHHTSKAQKTGAYKCLRCSKSFSRKFNLDRHLESCKVDNSEVSYKCLRCDKTFSRRYNLDRHMESCKHDNSEVPYKCVRCDKTFSRRYNLDRHMESCTAYKCDDCGKEFPTKLIASRKQKHNCSSSPKKHMCKLCGKVYIKEDRFKLHKCLFPCTNCKAVFKIHRHLKEHLRSCSIISHQYECKVISIYFFYFCKCIFFYIFKL